MTVAEQAALARWRSANPQGYAMYRLRVRHYLSVGQLGQALGVPAGLVVLYERGSRPVPSRIADRLRRYALRLAPRQKSPVAAASKPAPPSSAE